MSPEHSVLEVGCGDKPLAAALEQQGHRGSIVAIDFAQYVLPPCMNVDVCLRVYCMQTFMMEIIWHVCVILAFFQTIDHSTAHGSGVFWL
jgi:hypothetical protein